jgi:hypothetical protein
VFHALDTTDNLVLAVWHIHMFGTNLMVERLNPGAEAVKATRFQEIETCNVEILGCPLTCNLAVVVDVEVSPEINH